MDCKAPILGHSAVRCAGLSRTQSRLQSLPATFYLIGSILIVATWVKLALSRRIFSFQQVLLLSLTGVLGFSVIVAGSSLRYNGALSVALGGVTSFVGIFQLLAIYHFLPQPYTLPRVIDRLLAATFTSSMILNILSSVHLRGSSDSVRVVVAEATCLICFYLTCVAASLFPKFFVLVMEDCIERQRFPPKISLIPTATFLGSLILLLAQACVALSLYPTFASVFVASMASAIAYLLLVATFIIVNWSRQLEFKDDVCHYTTGKNVSAEHRSKDQDIIVGDSQAADPPPVMLNPPQRKGAITTVLEDEDGNVVHISNEVEPSDVTHRQVDYDRAPQRSAQTQTGSSRASWAKIQHLMMRKNQSRMTCISGVTDYGTETSYPEGCKTNRNSVLSSFAMAVGGYGNPVPPMPPASSQRNLLTNAKEPIVAGPVFIDENPHSSQEHRQADQQGASKDGINLMNYLPSFIRAQEMKECEDDEVKGRPLFRKITSHRAQAEETRVKYQSSKLFPAENLQISDRQVITSPRSQLSEVKHTMQRDNQLARSASSFASTDTAVNTVTSPGMIHGKSNRQEHAEGRNAGMVMVPSY